ncbi:hypothetical protein HMI54_006109 [Coelomomyces lativittatus]|nr:hypothetical protein HMI54_006109 [Coelomomyces lativittatus]KAJ1509027.1 hypothetical protein HMI55_000125 [Coelomomyces lativittatus]KAJ1511440.1 hypothetical protein HMI56_005390 [Coelomomyces lativittatus]
MKTFIPYLCYGVFLLLAFPEKNAAQNSQTGVQRPPSLPSAKIQQIINVHHHIRSHLGVKEGLVWDTELETVAQNSAYEIAQSCTLRHTKSNYAQNVFMNQADSTAQIILGVNYWEYELQKYQEAILHRQTNVFKEVASFQPEQQKLFLDTFRKTLQRDRKIFVEYGHALIMSDSKYSKLGCASSFKTSCGIRNAFFNIVVCEYKQGPALVTIPPPFVQSMMLAEPKQPQTESLRANPAASRSSSVVRPAPQVQHQQQRLPIQQHSQQPSPQVQRQQQPLPIQQHSRQSSPQVNAVKPSNLMTLHSLPDSQNSNPVLVKSFSSFNGACNCLCKGTT